MLCTDSVATKDNLEFITFFNARKVNLPVVQNEHLPGLKCLLSSSFEIVISIEVYLIYICKQMVTRVVRD